VRKIDLTGKRFHRLIVLEESGRDKWCKILWLCRCDCGTEKIICGESLKSGKTKSCGCFSLEIRSLTKVVDCNGKQFGRLLVTERVGSDKHGKALWKCLCRCGGRVTVTTGQLRSGHTKSCGCLSREVIIRYNKSEKHRKAASISNKKRKWTLETRQKNSMGQLKQTEEEWGGFTSPLRKQIYNWLNRRVKWHEGIKKRDSYTCQICGDGRGGNLHAHHVVTMKDIIRHNNIKSIDDAKQCGIFYDLNNGKTLCENCHIGIHSKLAEEKSCVQAT